MAKRQQLLNTFSSRGPGQQQQQHQQGADISGAAYSRPRQAGKVMKPAAMSRRQYMKPKQEQGAESSSSWRPPGFETEYGAYVADDEGGYKAYLCVLVGVRLCRLIQHLWQYTAVLSCWWP